MKPLRVSAVQMRSELGDVAHNYERMIELSSRCLEDGANLICFPEACLTGYNAQRSRELALAMDSPYVQDLCSFANEHNVTLSFGLIESSMSSDAHGDAEGDDGRECNRGVGELPFITQVLCAGGDVFAYRKTHLGLSERDWFTAGNAITVAQTPDACMGISLCWECSIADVAGTLRAKGAEIMLAPFASPLGGERRLESWLKYLPARARDNGMYVVACNALKPKVEGDCAGGRGDSCAGGHTIGHTDDQVSNRAGGGCAIFDPHGELIGSLCTNTADILTCELPANLPRTCTNGRMSTVSFYDYRRPELYS